MHVFQLIPTANPCLWKIGIMCQPIIGDVFDWYCGFAGACAHRCQNISRISFNVVSGRDEAQSAERAGLPERRQKCRKSQKNVWSSAIPCSEYSFSISAQYLAAAYCLRDGFFCVCNLRSSATSLAGWSKYKKYCFYLEICRLWCCRCLASIGITPLTECLWCNSAKVVKSTMWNTCSSKRSMHMMWDIANDVQ